MTANRDIYRWRAARLTLAAFVVAAGMGMPKQAHAAPAVTATAVVRPPEQDRPVAPWRQLSLSLKPPADKSDAPRPKRRSKKKMKGPAEAWCPAAVHLSRAGTRLCQFWYVEPGTPLLPVFVQIRERDASKLTISGKKIAGVLRFGRRRYQGQQGGPPTVWIELGLDVAIRDGEVEGKYTWKATGSAALETAGLIGGQALSDAELQQRQGLTPGHDYPCWRNSDGSGASNDSGAPLVDSLDQARVMWVSEDNMAGSWGHAYMNHLGGYASAVVADGRLCQYYFRPTVREDSPVIGVVGGRAGAWTEEDKKRYCRAGADEVVVCVDAATGLTTWKQAFIDEGVNLTGDAKGGPFNTPCISGGRIYVQGTRGQVYCLEAETGEPIWKHDFDAEKAVLTFALQEADGVVLVGGPDRRACYALDAETGEVRWGPGPMSCSGRGGGVVGPVRWVHGGTAYFVSTLRCVEAKTGRLRWTVPGGYGGCNATVSGDYLVVLGTGQAKGPDDEYRPCLACFRMSPDKVEKVWEQTPDLTGWWASAPVIYRGHVYGSSLCYTSDNKPIHQQFCVEMATGKRLVLRERADEYCGWLAQDGRLFRPGHMTWYNADPADFRRLGDAKIPLSSEECITPTLVDGRLFFRSNGGFMTCYDLRHPKMLAGEVAALDFTIHTPDIAEGAGAEVSWRTLNAKSVRIEPEVGKVEPQGRVVVRPKQTTTYTLTAEGPGPPESREAAVTVYAFHGPLTPKGKKPGLAATFYEHEGWQLTDFLALQPIREGTVTNLVFAKVTPKQEPAPKPPTASSLLEEDEIGLPGEIPVNANDTIGSPPRSGFANSGRDLNVAGLLTGYVKAPADGLYEFIIMAGDEAALDIAGKPVAQIKGVGSGCEFQASSTGKIALKTGWYPLSVRFCHANPAHGFAVQWRLPDGDNGPIPPAMLCH